MVRRRQQTHRSSSPKSGGGFVRIISGRWRGRKLPVHDVEGLRPTTDRVKETVFNWLAQDIPHARCLDLFAGSGGLGFEALSRSAEKVVMLELDKKAHQQLINNIKTLQSDDVEAINTDALSYLTNPGTPFDVVFIDPPFRKDLLTNTITQLENNGWLTDNAMIYIETEKELSDIETPAHWRLHREKIAGQVCYRLYEREKL